MKLVSRISLLVLILTTTGCTPKIILYFFNHTEGTIILEANDQKVFILKDAMKALHYYRLEFNFPMSVIFFSQTPSEVTRNYSVGPVPNTFINPLLGGIDGYEVRFQIEPNEFIYVLLPQNTSPTLKIDAQPAGFPLKPEWPHF